MIARRPVRTRRAEIATNIEQWPEGGSFGKVLRMRLSRLRHQLERCVLGNAVASERLQRLLAH